MSSYNQGSILSILYDVWISGTKLGIEKKQCITSISVKETVEGSDVATLQISDPEFLYIEDNIFLEDNTIKIKMGWYNTTYRVEFEGYISAIDIDFDSEGIPKLTVTCMDNTHIMNRQKKNKTFNNCTRADVVKKIVKSYGYTCEIDSNYKFTKEETITQSNQTDIDFITKLASDEVHPFTARLVGKTFYYVKMGNLTTPKMTLTYKKYPHEVISFSPKINKEYKQVQIESSTVNTSKKSTTTTKGTTNSSKDNTKKPTSGSVTENGSNSSKNASGGYTYNPNTKKWTKN